MKQPARVVLVCEDKQHYSFIHRFLRKRGWKNHHIMLRPIPRGHGSGVQWVRGVFKEELAAYRSTANSQPNKCLVVVTDADAKTVRDRIRQLQEACTETGIEPSRPDERVFFVIPKRNIETWLAYLRGEAVDESNAFPKYDSESRCHEQVDRLDAMCKDDTLEGDPPPSLLACCDEFKRFMDMLD